jgi:hypothetical protein
MNSSKLSKPFRYKNKWLIWNDTIFDVMDIVDCNDTINGVCLTGQTLEKCIDQCKGSCGAGYYVEMPDGNNICVPIRTGIHPDLNPVYRLRRQESRSELNNVRVFSFINTDVFPFPPEEANIVFYKDIVKLKDVRSNLSLNTKIPDLRKNNLVYMKNEEKNDSIVIIPSKIYTSQVLQYQPIIYGDKMQLSIPGTSLIMKQNIANILVWKPVDNLLSSDYFIIIPVSPDKKIGEAVNYGDKFIIKHNTNSLVEIKNGKYLELNYNNSNLNNIFTFESKMIGYYCDKNNSKPVPINKMKTLGNSGRYKGVTVGRDPNCWGVCDYLIPNTNDIYPYDNFEYYMEKTRQTRQIKKIVAIILLMSLCIIFLIIIIKRLFS